MLKATEKAHCYLDSGDAISGNANVMLKMEKFPQWGQEGRTFERLLSSFSLGRQPSSKDGEDVGVLCSVRPPPFSKVPPDTIFQAGGG